MTERYIGLLSGTSIDAIDAVMVDFSQGCQLLASHSKKIPNILKDRLFALTQTGDDELARMAEADVALGHLFADATLELLHKTPYKPSDIRAIGSHGQTLRHAPQAAYSLQIGDANIIAAKTGITTVADFRRKDMALGGQGAPLTPKFHQAMFASDSIDRIILNIGGIANLTLLPKDNKQAVIGYDSGPGNCLIDAWIRQQQDKHYDHAGQWAASGECDPQLLQHLLSDPFFHLAAPKSTGPDYFNLTWLQQKLTTSLSAVDIQASLTELTAHSISNAIQQSGISQAEILLCGGGVHNQFLQQRLQALLTNFTIMSTSVHGVSPDWLEAIAFAWFAKQTLAKKTSNLPSVTGAKQDAILGGVYFA